MVKGEDGVKGERRREVKMEWGEERRERRKE